MSGSSGASQSMSTTGRVGLLDGALQQTLGELFTSGCGHQRLPPTASSSTLLKRYGARRRRCQYPGYRIPTVLPGHGILARVTRRIHVIGIGAGDPDYVTAQAVGRAQRHPGLLRDGQGRHQGRSGRAAPADLRAVHPRARATGSSSCPTRRGPEPPRTVRLPAGRRRLARRAGRRVGRRDRDRTRARWRRRVPGVGRPVALRQHPADPRDRSPPTSTSTTTSSPASPRSRRSPLDIASRSTTLVSRCSSPPDGSCARTGCQAARW